MTLSAERANPSVHAPLLLITTTHPVFESAVEGTGINKSLSIHKLPVHQASTYGVTWRILFFYPLLPSPPHGMKSNRRLGSLRPKGHSRMSRSGTQRVCLLSVPSLFQPFLFRHILNEKLIDSSVTGWGGVAGCTYTPRPFLLLGGGGLASPGRRAWEGP